MLKFTQRRRRQPCKATASSSRAVRVRLHLSGTPRHSLEDPGIDWSTQFEVVCAFVKVQEAVARALPAAEDALTGPPPTTAKPSRLAHSGSRRHRVAIGLVEETWGGYRASRGDIG